MELKLNPGTSGRDASPCKHTFTPRAIYCSGSTYQCVFRILYDTIFLLKLVHQAELIAAETPDQTVTHLQRQCTRQVKVRGTETLKQHVEWKGVECTHSIFR